MKSLRLAATIDCLQKLIMSFWLWSILLRKTFLVKWWGLTLGLVIIMHVITSVYHLSSVFKGNQICMDNFDKLV